MDNISISLSETGANRDISEIRIDGVIDTITAGEFEEVIESLLKRGRYRIVVDLAGVDYISSAGWGIFISHIRDVRGNEGDIKLAGMIPNVFEIYELLEFDNVLQAHSTVEEARSQFGNGSPADVKPKPEAEITRMTVVDSLIDANRPTSVASTTEGGSAVPAPSPKDPETATLEQVRKDPFMTISEIVTEIAGSTSFDNIGWWKVFSILRRNHLLTKRSRFRFARKSR